MGAWQILVTDEERKWVHSILDEEQKTLSYLIMEYLDSLSKKYNIPLPKNRVNRGAYKHNWSRPKMNGKPKFMAKIDKELGL